MVPLLGTENPKEIRNEGEIRNSYVGKLKQSTKRLSYGKTWAALVHCAAQRHAVEHRLSPHGMCCLSCCAAQIGGRVRDLGRPARAQERGHFHPCRHDYRMERHENHETKNSV